MRLSSHLAAGLAAAAVMAMTFMPVAAMAQDQRIEDGIRHYVECFKFMLTDEARHAAFCSPSRGGEWFVPESEYSGSSRLVCSPGGELVETEGGGETCIYP